MSYFWPTDHDLKNIIDKLAQFVARNGPEFEHMTKQKQKDNPKFSFLFGGEYFNYYQYKVTTEQAGTLDKQFISNMNIDWFKVSVIYPKNIKNTKFHIFSG